MRLSYLLSNGTVCNAGRPCGWMPLYDCRGGAMDKNVFDYTRQALKNRVANSGVAHRKSH